MTACVYHQPRQFAPSPLESTPEGGQPLPVVIVGAGPVGMALALGLARRGVPSTVLEAATQVSYGSRAICISRHSLEAAARLGFGEPIEAQALAWHGGRSFYRDTEVLHFLMPTSPEDVRAPMVNIGQSQFEEAMVQALEAEPLVELVWGATVTGCVEAGEQVTVDVATAAGPRRLRARYAVACDGGRSAVRDLLGLRLAGTSYEGRYVIADIHWKSGLPVERMVWFDPPSNPGSTVIMHQQPGDIWRIDYQLDAGDDADAESAPERITERIGAHLAWLKRDEPWTLEWSGFYMARALALDSFVHGRVLFAGDAAHLVPIFGVRGLNSGMEDAETLAWMLAGVVTGAAGPALLQTYAAERRDAWTQNVANAGKSTLIMTPGDHGHRTTRDAVLALSTVAPQFSHLINPRQSSATHARRSPLTRLAGAPTTGVQPGDPVPDRRVRLASGESSSLDEVRGIGFGVYVAGPDPAELRAAEHLAEAMRAALPCEPVAVLVVGGSAPAGSSATAIPDEDGSIRAQWGAEVGEAFVVRPDGLLLARGRAGTLGDVPGAVVCGASVGSASSEAPVDAVAPDVARREAVWLSLSDAIEAAGPDDREGLLTRLTFVLGDQVDPEAFGHALALAARAAGR
ncbi:MAG: FAD-dependent monooxygenase [Dermatophilaceae bacterium]